MGAKSRPLGHFNTAICYLVRDNYPCKHRGELSICDDCWRGDKFEPEKGKHDSGKV